MVSRPADLITRGRWAPSALASATPANDGYFWFISRADDVIISTSYRIGPFELESVIMEHPADQETAYIGVPDTEGGEAVKAFVVLAPGYQASPALATEIQDHVKENTAQYEYPRQIEFIDELPKTISGKIRRTDLRSRGRAGVVVGMWTSGVC